MLWFALIAASVSASWHEMPSGVFYHADCVHQFDVPFHARQTEDGMLRVSFDRQKDVVLPPCPHQPLHAPPVNHSAADNAAIRAKLGADVGYYSDWVAYAQTVHPAGFGSMSSVWEVPEAPTSKGPAPPLVQSSIYLFNGLEDGHGHAGEASVILQPVLQYGKSGCLLNPLKWGKWYFTAYQVGISGRALCGPNMGPLSPGEKVYGAMTLTDAATNTWRTDAVRLSTGATSTLSSSMGDRVMDAAYLTLEGMVIYNCKAFPASGSVTFSNNTLADTTGADLPHKSWTKMLGHTECGQDVRMTGAVADPVTVFWDTAKDAVL